VSRLRPTILDRPELLAVTVGVLYLPFTLLGYGNDIDVPNVLRAGRNWLDGDYQISRRPGSTPVELASAVLDRVGGSVLVNLVSVAFAVVALAALGRILQREGVRRPGIAVLVLAAHPWFWVASTSLADFVWALALLLAGVDAAQRDRRVLAGVLLGLATGARATSVLLAAAWLVAERTGRDTRAVAWRATGVTGAVALVVAAACFVPPWLDQSGVELLEAGLPVGGVTVQLGRWAVKNLAVVGIAGLVVLAAGSPYLASALRSWRGSVAVRFGILGFVASELSFLRLPLKPAHLLPAVACAVLVAGVAAGAGPPDDRRRHQWLWALVAAQLLHGLVALRVAEPNRLDEATGGRFRPAIVAGVLVNDVRCRVDDRDRGEWPDPATPGEQVAAEDRGLANFTCQQRPWRPADIPLELTP
jgi:hypothetical protein